MQEHAVCAKTDPVASMDSTVLAQRGEPPERPALQDGPTSQVGAMDLSRTDCTDNDDAEAVARGHATWMRIKSGAHLQDWLELHATLVIGRNYAMHVAHKNKPQGRGYNEAFSRWLAENGFADMNKSTRACLFRVGDHWPEIKRWLDGLPEPHRHAFNHPVVLWRRYLMATQSGANSRPTSLSRSQEVALPKEAVARKEVELRRCDDGDYFSPKDRPADIARALIEALGTTKAALVVEQLKVLVEERSRRRRRVPL
jgi:hypothetical protein